MQVEKEKAKRVSESRQGEVTQKIEQPANHRTADAKAAEIFQTNKRRNLNSGQWATIAVEAEEVMGAIAEQVEKDADVKRSEATKAQRAGDDKKLSSPQKAEHTNTTATKAAEIFGTNRTYINQAAKIQKPSDSVRQLIAEPQKPDDQKTATKVAELFQIKRRRADLASTYSSPWH